MNHFFFKVLLVAFFLGCASLFISSDALAYFSPMPCTGPDVPGTFSASSVCTGSPCLSDTGKPAPKNTQFYCSTIGDTPYPPATYDCEENGAQMLYCKLRTAPSTDYYTCSYLGENLAKGATSYSNYRWLFDDCVHSLVPPDVLLSAGATSINLGQSTTLSWTSTNATTCTASGGWSGTQTTSGSQTITPTTTTTYDLLCTGSTGLTGSSSIPVTVVIPDTTAPSDPTGLIAAAVSTSQINLSWNMSTDTGGSGLAGYMLEQCSGASCTSFVQIAAPTTTSYSSTGLTASTSYSYRVRAYDNALPANNSGYSNIDSATTWTPVDTTPPSAPMLSGAKDVTFPSTQINLTWIASTDNVGVVAYDVYRNGGAIPIAILGPATLAYPDPGLTPSTSYSYYVRARDAIGNGTNSNTVSVTTDPPPDTAAPMFVFSSPAATLLAGTTFATLAGSTNESATCRYSTTSGLAFTAMTLFGTTGTTNHSQIITGLTDGTLYTYYVKCRDTVGNTNASDFSYMFEVDSPAPDTTPPAISNGAPTGVLAADTTSAIMSVITNENAYCRYNQNSDTTFALMTNALNSGDLQNHSVSLTSLTNGSSYLYYIRCQDTPGGNENTSGYAISFSVAFPANVNPVALITVTPTSGTAPLVVSADGSASYDTDGSIAQYIWKWGDGTPDTTGVPSVSYTYTTPGTYTLSLTVIDNQGGSGNKSQTITASAPVVLPPPPAPAGICTAACTTDADCTPDVCGPSGFCIAAGSGVGPTRFDGYLSRSDGSMSQPTPAVFPAGTTSVIMSVKTDVNAECQYSTFIDTPYGGNVMNTFSTTGTTAHAVTLTGLAKAIAVTYDYYVRCRDLATGIVNDTDYAISFTANAPNIVSGPNPYTCLINSNFIRGNIPYLFDICIPK